MSKSYKVSKKTMNMGPKKGKTVYSVRPYSYGTLTTKDIANQIAMESTATPADVMAVLDRYTYYVKENLKKGTISSYSASVSSISVSSPARLWRRRRMQLPNS